MSLNREYLKVEDGNVIGKVRTDIIGSEVEFTICPVEEAEEMTDKELQEVALDALFNSGTMTWDY